MNVFVLTEVVDLETNFVVGVFDTLDGAKRAVMLLANGSVRWSWEADNGALAHPTASEDDSNWEIERFRVQ